MNVQRVPAYADINGKKTEIGTALVDLDMGCATVTVSDEIFASLIRVVVPGTSIAEEVFVDPTQLCSEHKPRQHHDAKPPWCDKCGLTAGYEFPVGRLDREREEAHTDHEFTD